MWFTNLSEVKTHLGQEHKDKPWFGINHAKQDQANSDIISCEKHRYENLFPEMFPKS